MSTSHMYTTKSSSPSSSPSYRRDEKVVDADDIERVRTGTTENKLLYNICIILIHKNKKLIVFSHLDYIYVSYVRICVCVFVFFALQK